ncbi:MAG TPA: sulfatase [Polyangiales bacterium]|nr:sulfatase [Polyangiales bacterium]
MRILYIDIDTLRADHLGCYGYHRDTSPNIDRLAAGGVRFSRCYASDVPCLPSRTALFSGRFGTRNGVVGHGGTAAEPFVEGPTRGFFSLLGKTAWPVLLRKQGLYTAAISSFPARHSAYHYCAGFDELQNPGKLGLETADEIAQLAEQWLARHAAREHWFLHVHLWDPHTPYRAPAEYGEPFAQDPLPAWLTEEVRAGHFAGCGPHSAQEAVGFSTDYPYGAYPRQPRQIADMRAVRQLFDGYDTGVRCADDAVGRLVRALARAGVADDTAILISSDHGETLGELNVYGDHHTADEHTAHVPFILVWPGLAARVHDGLCYPLDVAASVVELVGGGVPPQWDGRSLAQALREGRDEGRPELVVTQGAWTCQRGVRWGDQLYIRTYHDGYHDYADELLFDVVRDPHEQHDLSAQRPELVAEGRQRLAAWHAEVMRRNPHGRDPLDTVMQEGGPSHTRGKLRAYLERLRATSRADRAERLERRHAAELAR